MDLKYSKVRCVKDPVRANANDAGIDVFVPDAWNNGEEYVLYPQERVLIPSGLHFNIPEGHALFVHNKSGVASKLGLDRLAEVIDEGYMGEVHVNIVNTGTEAVKLKGGMKIVQLVLLPVNYAKPVEVPMTSLYADKQSDRGDGGFGSTGTC